MNKHHNLRYTQAKRITLIGAAVNLLLAALKIIIGYISRSHSLVADGIHSLSDLLTDVLVLVTAKMASREADVEHPYGHGRIETVGAVGLALLLMLVSVSIIHEALHHIVSEQLQQAPGQIALVVAVFSVLTNEWLYRITLRVAKQINSPMLEANAWHHRSDAFSSVVVVIGLVGSLMGYQYFDALAAIVVALLIIQMAFDIGWRGINELIDTGLDEGQVNIIRETVLAVPGVNTFHQLRTRSMGGQVFVDVHVLVDSYLSVSEGHYIGETVGATLKQEFPKVSDVVVHIDPEDDEVNPPPSDLPNRKEIKQVLQQNWESYAFAPHVNNIILHYLAGFIDIEVWLPISVLKQYSNEMVLVDELQQVIADMDNVRGIKPVFLLSHKPNAG